MRGIPLQLALLLCVVVWWSEEARVALNSRIGREMHLTEDEDDDDFYGRPKHLKVNSKQKNSSSRDSSDDSDHEDDEEELYEDYNEVLTNGSFRDSMLVLFRKSATLGPANYTGVVLTRDTVASIHIDDPKNVVGCPFRKTEEDDCFGVDLQKEVRGVQYWRMKKPRDTPPQIPPKGRLLNFNRKLCKANANSVEITRTQKKGYDFKCSPSCNEGEVIICGKQPVGIWKRSTRDESESETYESGEEYGRILDLADLLEGLRSAAPQPTRPPPIAPPVEKQEDAPKRSESDEKKVRTSGMANRIVISTLLLFTIAALHYKFLS